MSRTDDRLSSLNDLLGSGLLSIDDFEKILSQEQDKILQQQDHALDAMKYAQQATWVGLPPAAPPELVGIRRKWRKCNGSSAIGMALLKRLDFQVNI